MQAHTTPPKNNPREMLRWCMYDWANSSYSLVIATAIFPIYFSAVSPSEITFLGSYTFKSASVYSYAIALANILIVLLGPVFGGVADARGWKKQFLTLACFGGATSCIAMYFFTADTIHLGIGLFAASTYFWAMSEIFYNSFLPEVATPEHYDRLSARGYTLGYIGSVILLIISLAIVMGHEYISLEEALATKITFVITGVWWAGFGYYAMLGLRGNTERKTGQGNILTRGFHELARCTRQLYRIPVLSFFLLTFLCYDMAVQAVMYVASFFGEHEMKLDTGNLILVLLVIQLVAVPGAYTFSRISETRGNLFALKIILLIWIAVCVYAYYLRTPLEFYLLGGVVGFVMGAVQSTSRATYTKLIPSAHADNATFFSFYGVVDKIAIILGTFTFGIVNELTGSMRGAILFLISYLVLGLLLLLFVPWQRLLQQEDHPVHI